jgi:hypothetical protein
VAQTTEPPPLKGCEKLKAALIAAGMTLALPEKVGISNRSAGS